MLCSSWKTLMHSADPLTSGSISARLIKSPAADIFKNIFLPGTGILPAFLPHYDPDLHQFLSKNVARDHKRV
jgi:hypothetical protein